MKRAAGLLAALALAASCAPLPEFPAPPVPQASDSAGYLDAEAIAALAARTPLPPASGSAQAQADRAALEALLARASPQRVLLAQTHAEVRPALAVQHFDCTLGTRLAADPPPALLRLMTRTLRDASAASEAAKARGHRARPIAEGFEPCIRADDALRASASHPSGHATIGALWGRIVAELAPDRAGEARRIGQEIGHSRAVCALHYPADVAAGQALGEALFDALLRDQTFRADLEAARVELAEARARGLTSPGCAAEDYALRPAG
ncbi:MAG: PA-phosphatase [Brevundimonas sp.]|uniref:PA-phosphatase n=1 Tax=Brevundimonas sp. TaxID=1871086 RepID=UPI00391DE54C